MPTPTPTPTPTNMQPTIETGSFSEATGDYMLYGFFPDRDNLNVFSVRVPRKAVIDKKTDSINVKIENDQGYICAEETRSRDLEIT